MQSYDRRLRAWDPVHVSIRAASGAEPEGVLNPDWRAAQQRGVIEPCTAVANEASVGEVLRAVVGFVAVRVHEQNWPIDRYRAVELVRAPDEAVVDVALLFPAERHADSNRAEPATYRDRSVDNGTLFTVTALGAEVIAPLVPCVR